MTTLIYLVRHGETEWNRLHRIQGITDIPLNNTGRIQAARAGRLLARRSWDGIFSSPLTRATETAELIASEVKLSAPQPLADLVERNYGQAEGKTDKEISRQYPGSTPIPGQESRESVAHRVMPALRELAISHAGKHLIVVTHGAVIRTVLMTLGATVQQGVAITNGSIHSFRHIDNELFELIEFNDPIELASIVPGAEDFEEQNSLEDIEKRSQPNE